MVWFFLLQARERNEKERLQKQQELDDNMTEIANHVFGDVLTENPAVAQSAFGPHRVITDRWKGMSPQQLEDIRKQQEKQRLEKEVKFYINMVCFSDWHHLILRVHLKFSMTSIFEVLYFELNMYRLFVCFLSDYFVYLTMK